MKVLVEVEYKSIEGNNWIFKKWKVGLQKRT